MGLKVKLPDNMTISEIAEATVWLAGKPLSLGNYNLIRPIYDRYVQRMMVKAGRQISKSVTLAVRAILNTAIGRAGYKILYVTPLQEQSKRFSTLNVRKFIYSSPLLRTRVNSRCQDAVRMKTFTNDSELHFGYTNHGVDRLRGIAADEINWDEIQDISTDDMFAAEQCMSASKYRIQLFTGTPKSLENGMEGFWNKSSMNEPVIKCSRCNYENVALLDILYKMMDPKGLVCARCKQLLSMDDVLNAYWLPTVPERESEFLGLHIPQIFLKYNLSPRSWKEIWLYYQSYNKIFFANEILGISMGLSGRLLTMKELQDNKTLPDRKPPVPKGGYLNICAGVDWGVSAATSFTFLVITALRGDGGWDVLFSKIYTDTDPVEQARDIVRHLRLWHVDICACDVGVGHANNEVLRRMWTRERVIGFNYCRRSTLLGYDAKREHYTLGKTLSLNNLFLEIKEGKYKFTQAPATELLFEHIMAETEEIRENSSGINKVFVHDLSQPDDGLHGLNFASVASKLLAKMVIVSNTKISVDEDWIN